MSFRQAAALALLVSLPLAAQEASLRALDSLWARNYATHDTASATNLMSDDFFMLSPNGRVKDKAAELRDVRLASRGPC
jgi:ketosteroid isomerase-like protein